MARLRSMLLLLCVLAGAAAEVAARCDLPRLAAGVLSACPAGEPAPLKTSPCCMAVAAAVGLGGENCFSLIAADPRLHLDGLNVTTLYSIYASCSTSSAPQPADLRSGLGAPAMAASASGSSTDGVVNQQQPPHHARALVTSGLGAPAVAPSASGSMTTSSTGGVRHHHARASGTLGLGAPAMAPSASGSTTSSTGGVHHHHGTDGLRAELLPSTCNPHTLATNIVEECTDVLSPTDRCCTHVVAAVDIRGCLCAVAQDSAIVDSGDDLSGEQLMKLYSTCGGIRHLPGSVAATCKGLPAPPPPPPQTEFAHLYKKDEKLINRLEIAGGFEAGVAFIVFLGDVYLIYLMIRRRDPEPDANNAHNGNNEAGNPIVPL